MLRHYQSWFRVKTAVLTRAGTEEDFFTRRSPAQVIDSRTCLTGVFIVRSPLLLVTVVGFHHNEAAVMGERRSVETACDDRVQTGFSSDGSLVT